MKLIESQIMTGEYVPNNFKLEHDETVHLFTGIENDISVNGIVFDESLNLELHFSKRFNDVDSAKAYFQKMTIKYPNSQIAIVEKTIKEIQVWA